ncbi:MAG: hypothetical protein ACRDGH_12950 [Candidatus Limnocylindria bacterium]
MTSVLYVIEHVPGPEWDDGVSYPQQPGVEQHVAFMRSLHDRGVLLLG